MAWLEQTSTGQFHVAFRYGGLKYKKSLRTRDQRAANARVHRIAENLRLLESGRLVLPANADIGAFLLSDGKLNAVTPESPRRSLRTLGQLATAFLASIPEGALETTTINGMKIHLQHLKRVLGASFAIAEAGLEDLQRYIEERSKARGIRGKTLSAATIKKEITTLRTLWNWAKAAGHVTGSLPLKRLRYPKGTEKPPFQTLAEIERRLTRGVVSDREANDLWAALFLTTGEIDELLKHVATTATHDFIYPMFAFAAHTGTRRSEMMRSEIDDIDFAGGAIIVRIEVVYFSLNILLTLQVIEEGPHFFNSGLDTLSFLSFQE